MRETAPAHLRGEGKLRARVLLSATACGLLAALAGCQSYNPNLGAPSVLSSQISYLTPSATRAGTGDFTLTVNGSGFVDGSVVQWNGGSGWSNRETKFVNATQLTASIQAADVATPGTFQVRVLAPGKNEGNNYSNIAAFQVCSGACPALSALRAQMAVAESRESVYSPAISVDRRYIAFASVSEDPSANGSAGARNIYLRDTCEGAAAGCRPRTILVSVAWHGGEPNGDSRTPSISADGRYVAFASDASDLIEQDTNGFADVFLRDTCIGAGEDCRPSTMRISVGAEGEEANGPSGWPSISADGRFVAFESEARNLVPDGSSSPQGAFLRDTCHGAGQGCVPSTTRAPLSSPLR